MSTLRTNAIIDASGGNTATINGIPLRQGVLDPENRIINGSFDFWQRGTSFSVGGYGADRWVNGFFGGTSTQSRQAFALGDVLGSNNPTFFLRQTVSGQTLTTQFANTVQNVESVRSYAGQTITVLGWARRSSGSGNMAVSFDQYFGSGGTPSATVNGSGQTVTLSGSWSPFAVTFSVPSVAGKTLGTNNNDCLSITFWTSAGSDFNARANSLGLQTIGVDLWGIHVKVGTHTADATALYKQPELGPELARCQRYYHSTEAGYGFAQKRVFNTTGVVQAMCISYDFPVTMRAAPTLAVFGDIGDGAQIQLGGAGSFAFINGFSVFTAVPNLQHLDYHFHRADAEL